MAVRGVVIAVEENAFEQLGCLYLIVQKDVSTCQVFSIALSK